MEKIREITPDLQIIWASGSPDSITSVSETAPPFEMIQPAETSPEHMAGNARAIAATHFVPRILDTLNRMESGIPEIQYGLTGRRRETSYRQVDGHTHYTYTVTHTPKEIKTIVTRLSNRAPRVMLEPSSMYVDHGAGPVILFNGEKGKPQGLMLKCSEAGDIGILERTRKAPTTIDILRKATDDQAGSTYLFINFNGNYIGIAKDNETGKYTADVLYDLAEMENGTITGTSRENGQPTRLKSLTSEQYLAVVQELVGLALPAL